MDLQSHSILDPVVSVSTVRRPNSGTSRASSKGCGIEVEHARACYPHDPPASFTGTSRALYDTPTSTPRPLSPPN